ncbi:hypothetical protein Q4534_08895 [Cyclobacterium sp. 1_MG-2023]|uniref:hypothetical protein n=1 Tax=Cyclobacterium sp. 1_MG-2023 TaxID=3062681 RepID=UPI0026E49107|nr:hypothetical protein [Cyclobacterium sp. 1_MG-2023]MDO6437521.1 hypothetical protein [Cyclobacterium sp. 1_MG-2023]
MKVRVRIVRAIDDVEATEKYIFGHHKVLESYGITKVTSADRSWALNPHVYLILFESMDDQRVLGGGRIQLRTEYFPLPFELAIKDIDPKIEDYLSSFKDLEVAEYCGLWNSREVAGYGIGSIYLVRVGIAILPQLNLKKLFGLSSPVTLSISKSVGYEIITGLGDKGSFYYPKEGLIATALEINDINELSKAQEAERDYIFELRNKINFNTVESGPKGEMELQFELQVPKPSNEKE